MSNHKKILCLDFDGVIHSYTSGWRGPRNIPDPPVPGAIEFIDKFIMEYCDCPDSICAMAPPGEWELHIYSSRSRYWFAKRAMRRWLVKHGLDRRFFEVIKFPTRKPPATLLIDDRALTFVGIFPAFESILEFKPWNVRRGT
jgi:hypothetical protein